MNLLKDPDNSSVVLKKKKKKDDSYFITEIGGFKNAQSKIDDLKKDFYSLREKENNQYLQNV